MILDIPKRKHFKAKDEKGIQEIEALVKGKDPTYLEKLATIVQILEKETKILSNIKVSTEAYSWRQQREFDIREDWKNIILNTVAVSENWIRNPEEFKSKSHSPEKQLSALLRHLFAKYPTPEFLNASFANPQFAPVFIHIAQGGNIRTADVSLPKLTKHQAHLFHSTPGYMGLMEANIRARALSYNVDKNLLAQILKQQAIKGGNHGFWNSFFEFLGRQDGMVNPEQIGPIVDFLNNQRRTFVDGELKEFTFKGKTMASIFRHMEEWHNELAKVKAAKNRVWNHNLYIKDAEIPSENPQWEITEICTEKELHAEGKAMHHCVYSYTGNCVDGKCSIWSMRGLKSLGHERIATIEVRGNAIAQVRGQCNAAISNNHSRALRKWAAQNNLTWKI